jgi:hypothetical protein
VEGAALDCAASATAGTKIASEARAVKVFKLVVRLDTWISQNKVSGRWIEQADSYVDAFDFRGFVVFPT